MLDSNKIKPVKSKFSATRAYGNNRYIVYSPKLGREVILYSNLEYYCFLLLEFDSEVSFYCEQPNLNISQNIEGKIKKSIVDFIAGMTDNYAIDVYNTNNLYNNTLVVFFI